MACQLIGFECKPHTQITRSHKIVFFSEDGLAVLTPPPPLPPIFLVGEEGRSQYEEEQTMRNKIWNHKSCLYRIIDEMTTSLKTLLKAQQSILQEV